MKKIVLILSLAFLTSCSNDDNINVPGEQDIYHINLQSTFASKDKEEIPVNITFTGNDSTPITLNINFNGTVKLNGQAVTGNFQYNPSDSLTFKPNEFGRTTAQIRIVNNYDNFTYEYDFYTIAGNSQESYVFLNNVIMRSARHFNGTVYYATIDGSSYSTNRLEMVVLSANDFDLVLTENKSVVNSNTFNFQGTELLNKYEVGLLEQNFGQNSFKFTFNNGHIVDIPFNYVQYYNN